MKYILFFASWVFSLMLSGQEINFKWKKNPCQVGQVNKLFISIKEVKKQAVNYSPWNKVIVCKLNGTDSISGVIEQIDSFQIKQTIGNWKGTYSFIPWDTGHYEMPVLTIQIGDSIFKKQVPNLHVTYTKTKKEYDIKEWFISLPQSIWYILVVIIGVLSAAFGIWWWKKSKKSNSLQRTENPIEKALSELEDLKSKKLWEKGEIEQHFIRFSLIIKTFLTRFYGLPLMERTTQESVLLLQAQRIEKEEIEMIEKLLLLSDFAKFADAQPSEKEIIASFDQTYAWISSKKTKL